MKVILILISVLLIAQVSFAKECIVDTLTDYVKEWTSGTYQELPPTMQPTDELKTFKTLPTVYDKRLKYENGDMVITNEDKPITDKKKEELLKLLEDEEIKNKIKAIKNM